MNSFVQFVLNYFFFNETSLDQSLVYAKLSFLSFSKKGISMEIVLPLVYSKGKGLDGMGLGFECFHCRPQTTCSLRWTQSRYFELQLHE